MPETSAVLLAGGACRAIDPRPGVPLVGYPRDRPNTGVGLGLCLRAVVFGPAGSERAGAALLVLDTLSVGAGIVAEIRARVRAALPGVEESAILVAATHTHSAPTLDAKRKGDLNAQADAEYVATVLDAAGEAARAAWAARGAVSARVGLAEMRLGHNRRSVDPAGKATNDWHDLEGRHHGYFNPNLRFLSLDDPVTGKPRLLLSSYGCHPVVLGPKNTLASADYPGYCVRRIERETGAALAVHLTGAAANINPRECILEEAERARPMGEALAEAVRDGLPRARPVQVAPPVALGVPLALTLGPLANANFIARAKESTDGKTLLSEVQVLCLGEVAFVSAPGELFAEIGTAIENSSPFPHTFIAGYANDNLGYLVTEAAGREGGYEASRAVSDQIERPLLAAAREALERSAGRVRTLKFA